MPDVPLALLLDDPSASQGFSWTNLLVLLVIVAVLAPVITMVRRRASRSRRERWAREEQEGRPFYTEDNDPDLRRDDPGR